VNCAEAMLPIFVTVRHAASHPVKMVMGRGQTMDWVMSVGFAMTALSKMKKFAEKEKK